MFELCSRSVDFRASGDPGESDGRTLEGYAAVFDQDTEINSWEGRFSERVAKGAFKKTLKERKPIMQYDHGRDTRVGSVPIGVYEELREDDHGLYVSGRVFDNDVVEPVRQAIEAQAITGMSFKFKVTRDEWRDSRNKLVRGDEIMKLLYEPGDRGPLQRTIKEVQLFEAGPVASPAYSQTSVGMRSLEEMTEADREELAAQYRRSMTEVDEDEQLDRWLEAETEYKHTVEWLDAEKRYAADVEAWLEAERAQQTSEDDDAARSGTSSEPEHPETDAARSGTSHRETNTPPLTKKEKSMTLEELRTRLAEIDVRFEELGEESRDAELPADAQTEWDGLEAERAEIEKSIERIEKRTARLEALSQKEGHVERGSDRGTPAFHKERDIYDLSAIRSDARSEEHFVDLARDNARRAIDAARIPSGMNREAVQERMRDILDNIDGEDGAFAKRMLLTGSPGYERAFGKAVRGLGLAGLSPEEQRDLALGASNGAGGNGGYAVPVQLDPTVIHTGSLHINPLRGLARVVQITGKEWQGVTSNAITVTRDVEAAAITGQSPTLTQPTVRANRVAAFVPFSFEIEQDWGQMRSEISSLLAEAKDVEEATSFTSGDGTGVNAGGIITTLAVGSDVAAGSGTLNNPFGGTPSSANLYKLEEALPVRYRANAKFMASKPVFNKIRQIDTSNGPDLWVRIGAGTPSQVLGYDSYENSAMKLLPATNGDRVMVFGDFSKFLIVDRIGMSIELVPHVFSNPTGTSVVPTGQRGLLAVWRNNSTVLVSDAFRALKVAT